jgi:Tfp pilus assembly protein PilO
MSSSNRLIISILLVAGLAIAFWTLALGPKREEASELSAEAGQLQVALSEAQAKAVQAAAAKRAFPADYRQLVVLGQAAPQGDETSSLLVQLNSVANKSKVSFNNFQLESTGEAPAPTPAPSEAPPAETSTGAAGSVPASSTIPPTEAAASLMPLGASIGPAGLGVMPYSLGFKGNFFQVADFIKRIDSLVHTNNQKVSVNGRLVTLDGFALAADPEKEFPHLIANFAVTTYVVPPTQGLTAGASPTGPAPITTPAGAAQAASSSAEGPSESETVAVR